MTEPHGSRQSPRGVPARMWTVAVLAALLLTLTGCIVGQPTTPPAGTPGASQGDAEYGEPEVILVGTEIPPDLSATVDVRTAPEPGVTGTSEPNSASTLEAKLALGVDEQPSARAGATPEAMGAPGEPSAITFSDGPLPTSRGILLAAWAGQYAQSDGRIAPEIAASPSITEALRSPVPAHASEPSGRPGALGMAGARAGQRVAVASPDTAPAVTEVPASVTEQAPATPAQPEVQPGANPPTEIQPPADQDLPPGEATAIALPLPAQLPAQPAETVTPETPGTETPVPAIVPVPAIAVPDGTERSLHVPILMYHYLSVPPADADIYRRDLSVTPDLFAKQLDRIAAEGYTVISLYDLYSALVSGAPLPEKPVVITFDDGYRDAYENAFPILREHGMKATFFVLTDFMDENRPEYLTWDMAREMLAAGMSIESHGRNHVSLEGKDHDYLVWQALGSLQTIQYELGVAPRFVSYPAGEYDQNTIDIFRSANFLGGVTTEQGATHASNDLFELTRVRVRGSTTPDDLSKLLAADW